MTEMIKNRYEFVLFFDVENGNPNGDPDAGNMPRIDPQTGLGIVTDVCIKRKVRNYIEVAKEGEDGFDVYVTEGSVLNKKQAEAYQALGLELKKDKKEEKQLAQDYMCRRFYDIRTFGAVMDTGDAKCGQVRGPVQLCFSKSIDSILQQDVTITRMASTTEKENASENRTMGRKYIVPYGLYRLEGFVNAKLAQKTGFSCQDLDLFFQSLQCMFDHDRSAARGKMSARKLFVFKHECELGNAPASALFNHIVVAKKEAIKHPRAFEDYEVRVNPVMSAGVELLEML